MKTFENRILNEDGSVYQSAAAQFSDADIARYMAMVQGRYPTVDIPASGDTPATTRAATEAESFAMRAGALALIEIAGIQSYEREMVRPASVQFMPVKS